MGTTANPFDILPANLFNLFSTQGYLTLQRHYLAILLRLYALAEFNRHGLSREMAVAEIVDYLKTEQAEADVAAAMASDTDLAAAAISRQPRASAIDASKTKYAPSGKKSGCIPGSTEVIVLAPHFLWTSPAA
jgi:hypothetical protein